MYDKYFKIMVTGHRTSRLRGREAEVKNWLREVLINYKEVERGNREILVISGMADGTDILFAEAGLELGCKLLCVFACRKSLSEDEMKIGINAVDIIFNEDKYSRGCFDRRDQRMVDEADLVVGVWDGADSGGTARCLDYARERGKEVLLFPWGGD